MATANLKTLTSKQYDDAKNKALQRIQNRIGEKPTRAQFKREYGRIWNTLDILAIIIFIAALAISSVHILAYAGQQANSSFVHSAVGVLGIQLADTSYGVIHQIGFILLAESAMLLFFVLARTSKGYDRYLSGLLAVAAVAFVFTANIASGLNPFLSILAPGFTVGIGFRLEKLIAISLHRTRELDTRYRDALAVWELASQDPEQHPDFQAVFKRELWDAIARKNRIEDAPAVFKHQAVAAEMKRDTWAFEESNTATTANASNGHGEHQDFLSAMPVITPPPATVNGHTNDNGAGSHA